MTTSQATGRAAILVAGAVLAASSLLAPPLPAQGALTATEVAAVDSVFAPYARGATPGCAVGVVRGGRLVHGKGYGYASLEHGVPIGPRTVFDIGSTSKQFTAASLALLALDGRLSLDDDVRKYLPELPDLGARVTLRHLLHHTSGWRDYTDLMSLAEWDDRDHTTDREALDALARQRALNFAPGSTWRYSNSGYFLAALVVKRVAGKSLAEFARERIFAPLGMTDTRYLDDTRVVVPGRATAYVPADSGRFHVAMSDWEQLGDGAVQTTVLDLAKWDANLDDPKVGGPKLVELLLTRGRLADGRPLHYALGLTVDAYRGAPRVQHGGAWAGYRAMFMRFPAQRLTVLTLCNRGDAGTMQLSERVAGALLPPPPTTPVVAVAATSRAVVAADRTLAGIYRSDAVGILLRVQLSGDSLVVPAPGGARALVPLPQGGFRHPGNGAILRFARASGDTVYLTVRGAGGQDTALVDTLRRVSPAAPLSASQLAELAGRWVSAEAGAAWELRVRDGALVLRGRRGDDVVLRQLFADGFAGPGVPLFRVVRDAGGRAAALSISTRGVTDLRFVRE
jgi:CubicO group peptidase (beta-lactamase class C family)